MLRIEMINLCVAHDFPSFPVKKNYDFGTNICVGECVCLCVCVRR